MLPLNQQITNKQHSTPGIPRVKFKKKGVCNALTLNESERLSLKANHLGKNQLDHFQYKENLQPILIEKKKMEATLKKNQLYNKNIFGQQIDSHNRLSLDSSDRSLRSREDKQSINLKKIFQMDNYCLKMSESIILSSNTIDSQSQQHVSLSSDSFIRLKPLGKGKFGQVFLVMHKQSGFICAMKIISKKVIKEEKVEEQIIKQIKIHNSLQSGNVVEFYGFFDDQDSVYLLLQYAMQGCLLSKFKGRNRIEEQQIKPITKGICEGLKHIHENGYVHRDMKPENVVLQFGIPKICDFGWATHCDDAENLCKSYCGTPLYLSPEMIKRQFYGTSVDIWSVGLITYQLLVGRVPFSIWSQNDLFMVLSAAIKFPQYIDRSEECEKFILGALERDAIKRTTIKKILSHPFLTFYENHQYSKQIDWKMKQLLQ